MTVILPEINKEGTFDIWKPMRNEDHMIHQFKCGHTDKMMCLKNKPPVWTSALNAYVLNFFGRVTMPSVKNFQLVLHEDG